MTDRLQTMPPDPLPIVCCFIFDDRGRILLLQRHSDDLGGGLWAAPGGKQEPNEDPWQTAQRETQEETGLALEALELLGSHEMRMPHGVAHMTTFKACVRGETIITINPEEHEAYHWFDLNSLLQESDIIWGLPTQLLDFGFLEPFATDPTLADGSEAILLELTKP